MSENPRRRRRRRRRSGPQALIGILIAVIIALTGFIVYMCVDMANRSGGKPSAQKPGSQSSQQTEPEATAPPVVVSSAKVLSTGDVLMHMKCIKSGLREDGTYNYDYMFRFIRPYVSAADCALANLETTTAGTAKPYQGNPKFNCPDEIDDALKNAGFDILMTANNHCFDTDMAGFLRTLEVARAKGFDVIGTMASAEEPKYLIKEINGIKIGMVNYTYETSDGSGSFPSMNFNPMAGLSYENINCYVPEAPQKMYNELERYIAEMKAAGAEATMIQIHWGPMEYQLAAPAAHMAMAQKFCDLGFDVVVGGHPHVVQPMDLLTSSTDPNHKTVVLYSMGNAVSNQRRIELPNDCPTGHSEDGVLFSVTFDKYSDGTVKVGGTELIPTWVNLTYDGKYDILPLDKAKEDQWGDLYGISGAALAETKNSYQRTMDLVGPGLQKCQDWIAGEKQSTTEDPLGRAA